MARAGRSSMISVMMNHGGISRANDRSRWNGKGSTPPPHEATSLFFFDPHFLHVLRVCVAYFLCQLASCHGLAGCCLPCVWLISMWVAAKLVWGCRCAFHVPCNPSMPHVDSTTNPCKKQGPRIV